MKLFSILILISSTCFAATKTEVLPQKPTECAARKDLKGTKINCFQENTVNKEVSSSQIDSELEMELALIEEQMGPPPAPVSEDEDLRLE